MNLELQKEQAVQALCAHYAQDHLSTGELEARFEQVYRSTSAEHLRTIFEGLPAIGALVPAPAPLYSVGAPRGGLPANEKRYVAIFSEVRKEGQWVPAARIAARVIFGNVVFDFREAILPPEGVELDVDVMLGEVKVLLPPGVGAEVDCTAVMGSVNDKSHRALPGAPVVRVRGGAVLGSITVVTKIPKADRMESWRRQLRGFFGTGGETRR